MIQQQHDSGGKNHQYDNSDNNKIKKKMKKNSGYDHNNNTSKKFEKYFESYSNSKPVQLAQPRKDFSVGDEKNVTYYMLKAFDERIAYVGANLLPTELISLIELQTEDGRFIASKELKSILVGVNIALPPKPFSSIADWKWTTSLVLAYIRREGIEYAYHEKLASVYDKVFLIIFL